jgi:hypothetical protein
MHGGRNDVRRQLVAQLMMYSPRSVSTGVMPFASRWSLMAISSPIIDLPLVTVFAPSRRQMSSTMRLASSAVTA